MSEPVITMVGADDPFYLAISEKLLEKGFKFGPFPTHYPIPENSLFSDCPRLEVSKLYTAAEVKSSITDLNEQPLSKVIFPEWDECEFYFLNCIDRLSAIPKSIQSHKLHFRELVSLFFGYFEKYPEVTHVIFTKTPHFAWDIVFYFVAKSLNKTTMFFYRTDLNHEFIIRNDWRKMNTIEGYTNPDCKIIRLTDLAKNSFWANYSQKVNISILQHSIVKKNLLQRIGKKLIKNLTKDKLRRLNIRIIYKRILHIFRLRPKWLRWFLLSRKLKKNKDLRWSDSSLFAIKQPELSEVLRLMKFREKFQKKQLDLYQELSRSHSLEGKYIFFALHFQPERSTTPEGREFTDQYLAIQMISNSLPSGWKLLVKEHPRQFDSWPPDLRKLHCRPIDYYTRIAKLPGVELLPLEQDTIPVIEKAAICSTITGTVGWQGLKMGKPAMIFSYSWYSECKACFVCNTNSEVKHAIHQFEELKKKDVLVLVDDFLKLFSNHLFVGSIGEKFAKESTTPYSRLVNSMANALEDRIKGLKPVL